MTNFDRVDRFVSVTIALATLVAVGLMVEGRFSSGRSGGGRSGDGRLERISDWKGKVSRAGVAVSTQGGRADVYVFTDFECPYCGRLDSALRKLVQESPGSISLSIVHLPLDMHRYARAAASSFECAAAQGRAEAMHRVLFSSQATLGTVSWEQLGVQAAVPDSLEFRECLQRDDGKERIEAGLALAADLQVNGTPVAVVNGWLLEPSTPVAVERAIAAVLDGKSPKP